MMIEMIINYDSDDDHNDNNDDDGDDDAVQNISYQANDESGGSISLQYSSPNAPETYFIGNSSLEYLLMICGRVVCSIHYPTCLKCI